MIICAGEALIDMLPRNSSTEQDCYLPVCGGAVFNTAIGLGRLGAQVSFLAGISTDFFGDQLIGELLASNVDTRLCLRRDLPSTLAFVKLVEGDANYLFYDENSAGRMLETTDIDQLPKRDLAAHSVLHLGAISLIAEPCGSTLEELAHRSHQDMVISLDPNIREDFISDAASHYSRIDRLIGISDIVKVSNEDLLWIARHAIIDSKIEANIDAEIDTGIDNKTGAGNGNDLVAKWLERGVSLVVVTRGSQGCEAYVREQSFTAAPVPIKLVDTIGAGDSFNAGLLFALQQQGVLDKAAIKHLSPAHVQYAIKIANEVAAINCSRAGANPPRLDELAA